MGEEIMWCCLLSPCQNLRKLLPCIIIPLCCFQHPLDVTCLLVFWSWCWAPWSVQLSLIAAIIKPFCYKPNSLKIIFFVYCTCQGRAPATFNDAGNPITANTNTPLEKGCRPTARFFLPAFPRKHLSLRLYIKIWIFCRKTLSFWAKFRQSLE